MKIQLDFLFGELAACGVGINKIKCRQPTEGSLRALTGMLLVKVIIRLGKCCIRSYMLNTAYQLRSEKYSSEIKLLESS